METPGGITLRLTCALGAPRERVFRWLTQPSELAQWWGPRGFTTPELWLEPRSGGGYRFTMQPPEGERFHLSGEFLEVHPPRRLVYTFRWDEPTPDDRETVVTIELRALGGETEITLTQGPFTTEERLELHLAGWTDALEKLRERVESADAAPSPDLAVD